MPSLPSAIAGAGYKADGASRTTCGLVIGGVMGRAAGRGRLLADVRSLVSPATA
jgi:hypothetical protein